MPKIVITNSDFPDIEYKCDFTFQKHPVWGKKFDLTTFPQLQTGKGGNCRGQLWRVRLNAGNEVFRPGDSFELSAGLDPDIVFESPPTFQVVSFIDLGVKKSKPGKDGKVHDHWKWAENLFAQTYGNTFLYLRRYDANFNAEDTLIIPVVNTVPKEKRELYHALTEYLYQNAHGYFLIDSVRGQTVDKVSQEFHFGYSSFNDPELELFSIKEILTSDFRLALLDVLRNPDERFFDVNCPKRLSKIRRVSPSALRRRGTHLVENPMVWASVRVPSFETPCNNVISTFLDTLLRRINAIADYFTLTRQTTNAHQKDTWKRRQDSRVETATAVILDRCNELRKFLMPFLKNRVFAFSEKRRETIFKISMGCRSKSPCYRSVLNTIRKYSLTNFYWTGDPSPLFRQPAYIHAKDGRNTWIRKYSMLYEFWCYMRMHQVFRELGFRTSDIPQNGRMRVCSYMRDEDNLRVVLYHDVGVTNETMPIELESGGKTPDFALFFENQKTKNLALVILDAKSSPDYAEYIPRTRNKYLTCCGLPDGSEQSSRLKMKQSWIVISGDDCPSFGTAIECPPKGIEPKDATEIGRHINSAFDELSCDGTDRSFREQKLKTWLQGLEWSSTGFSINPIKNHIAMGAGYLFTHIKRSGSVEDAEETDRFKLFLEAQIKLMETILA